MPSVFNCDDIYPFDAVVIIYDLAGFTYFLNRPDAARHAGAYLNKVVEAVDLAIYGGEPYWETKFKFAPVDRDERAPVHRKFLGDGELLVWDLSKVTKTRREIFAGDLLNDFWNLHASFKALTREIQKDLPIVDLPGQFKFGLTRGWVWPLKSTNKAPTEYVGVPVNLAARLQAYCPSLGVIASARTELPFAALKAHKYETVIAKKIKGFDREKVIVDKPSYDKLQKSLQIELFGRLDHKSIKTASAPVR